LRSGLRHEEPAQTYSSRVRPWSFLAKSAAVSAPFVAVLELNDLDSVLRYTLLLVCIVALTALAILGFAIWRDHVERRERAARDD
jgi:hypothetical protein